MDLTKNLIKYGKEFYENCWVYEKVLTLLLRDPIVVFGRRATQTLITKDLPVLQRVYRVLEPNKNPPTYKKVKACEYHCYIDDHPNIDVEDEYD